MITTRIAAAIAAGALSLGILTGSAATIVVGNATTPQADFATVMTQHMAGQGMGSMMSGAMSSMMSMMSGSMGSMMGPGSWSGPDTMGTSGSSFSPDTMSGNQHEQHHAGDSR